MCFKNRKTLTSPDNKILIDIVKTKMPFGKYKNTLICNLPVSYLEWFQREGFPKGRLGMMIATMYEIKTNGLEYVLDQVKASLGTKN